MADSSPNHSPQRSPRQVAHRRVTRRKNTERVGDEQDVGEVSHRKQSTSPPSGGQVDHLRARTLREIEPRFCIPADLQVCGLEGTLLHGRTPQQKVQSRKEEGRDHFCPLPRGEEGTVNLSEILQETVNSGVGCLVHRKSRWHAEVPVRLTFRETRHRLALDGESCRQDPAATPRTDVQGGAFGRVEPQPHRQSLTLHGSEKPLHSLGRVGHQCNVVRVGHDRPFNPIQFIPRLNRGGCTQHRVYGEVKGDGAERTTLAHPRANGDGRGVAVDGANPSRAIVVHGLPYLYDAPRHATLDESAADRRVRDRAKRIGKVQPRDDRLPATPPRVSQDLLQDKVVLVAPFVAQESLLRGTKFLPVDRPIGETVGNESGKQLRHCVAESERAPIAQVRAITLLVHQNCVGGLPRRGNRLKPGADVEERGQESRPRIRSAEVTVGDAVGPRRRVGHAPEPPVHLSLLEGNREALDVLLARRLGGLHIPCGVVRSELAAV